MNKKCLNCDRIRRKGVKLHPNYRLSEKIPTELWLYKQQIQEKKKKEKKDKIKEETK